MHKDWLSREQDILNNIILRDRFHLQRLTAAGDLQGVLRGLPSPTQLNNIADQFKWSHAFPSLDAIQEAVRFVTPQIDELRRHAQLAPGVMDSIVRELDWLNRSPLGKMALPGLDIAAVRDANRFQKAIQSAAEGLFAQYGQLSLDRLTRSLDRVVASLAGVSGVLNTIAPSQEVVDGALVVTDAYSRYCSRQLLLAQRDVAGVAMRRLTIADLAGAVLDNHQTLWERLAVLREEASSAEVLSPVLSANVFSETNRQLANLYRGDSQADPYLSFEVCDAVATSTLGSRIVELVVAINASRSAGDGTTVFKITDRVMLAASTLPTVTATDEARFADVVDGLYFMLYEGSGDAKRLTDGSTPVSLDALWLLKTLRNGLRHDIEHGSAGEVRRKRMQLGEAYSAICGLPRPIKPSDWRAAQLGLYQKIAGMLEAVHQSPRP